MANEVPAGFTYFEDDEALSAVPPKPGFKLTDLPCFRKKLSPEEAAKKKEEEAKKKEEEKRGSLLRLYFSYPPARWRLIAGVICAILHGAMLPGFSALFGELFNTFFKTPAQIREDIITISLFFVLLGCASFIVTYFQVSNLAVAAELLTRKLRHDFFEFILAQDAAWMDSTSSGAIASRISGDMTVIQTGIGERIGQFVFNYAQFFTGLVIAFVYGWKMTLVLLSLSPALIVSGALQAHFIQLGSSKTQTLFTRASTLLEETISGYRTVLAFVLGGLFYERFNAQLKKIDKVSVSLSHWTGLGIGVAFFIIFAIYALGFWYAGILVSRGEMKAGDALAVFFAVVLGALGLGQASQISPDFDKARGALAAIGEIMSKTPKMDLNKGGRKLKDMQGNVKLTNVAFTYPTRPDRSVFTDLTLEIKAGKSTAIVGASGGGKSTIVQLIERFYDVDTGSVEIDGVNVKELDTEWMRTQMALVSQEPVLFSCSIAENIRYGKHDATDEEVVAAAKLANAHNFIDGFPDKYSTLVGERGTQLSGGQKQRVAIARAVLRNPKLLLLDEATSALDAESEVLVQEALTRLMQNRTSVVVAHRLSTIRRADTILVLGRGKVEEQGTHDELLAKRGAYYDLVLRQLDEHGGHLDDEGSKMPANVKAKEREAPDSKKELDVKEKGKERKHKERKEKKDKKKNE